MSPAASLAFVVFLHTAPGAPSACPAVEAIQASLLPSTAQVLRAHHEQLLIWSSASTLRVELADPFGAPLLERTLATTAPCAARTAAAATLVDAMELELHGGSPVVDLPPDPAPELPAVAAQSGHSAGTPINLEFGAAFFGSLSQSTLAPAAALTIELSPGWSGLRLRANLFAEGRRSLAIGTGSASYQDSWVALGPAWRIGWRRFSIEAGVSLAGALQELNGDGVTSMASRSAFEGGASFDVAVGWSVGSWRIWAGYFGIAWPANTKVTVAAVGDTRALPAWENLLGGGVQFTAF